MTIYYLIWSIVIFIIAFITMYYALQALDFSKLFKANSTLQIKLCVLFISCAVAFAIMKGFVYLVELFGNLF